MSSSLQLMPLPDLGSNHETLQASIIACSLVMMLAASVVVELRLYTRRYILKSLGWDDWIIALAMLFSIGVTIGQIRQTFFALGRHVWTVTESDMRAFKLEQWYTYLFYATSLSLTKLSILLLYMKFMTQGAARAVSIVVLVIVVIADLWAVFSQLISCVPLHAVWDIGVPNSFCLSISSSLANSILNIVTDFAIFILPIPFLFKLKLPPRQRTGLILVFSLGFIVCIVSIIRVCILATYDFSDPTFAGTVAYLGSVEVNLAIICACLTTIKPLLAKFFPKHLSSMHSRYRSSQSVAAHNDTYGVLGQRSRLHTRSFAKLEDSANVHSLSEEGFALDTLDVEVAKNVLPEKPAKSYRIRNP